MAKFERRIRIELNGYEQKWKDSFIVIATLSHDSAQEYDRTFRRLRKQMEKYEEIEKMSDSENAEYEATYENLSTRVIRLVKQQFREGVIWSDETNSNVPLEQGDLGGFDLAVLTQIVEVILGKISKKK